MTWGDILGSWPIGNDIILDSSGNIYVAGEVLIGSYYDAFLIKLNSSGDIEWERIWSGADDDYGSSVAIDSSDNVYLVGWTRSFGAGIRDAYIAKYNSSGYQVWNTTWGGPSTEFGLGASVDSDDNIYIVGSTMSYGKGSSDGFVAMYNSSGDQKWNTTFGGVNSDKFSDVIVDADKTIYLAGETYNFGTQLGDALVVVYNSTKHRIWNSTWGGSQQDQALGIAIDSQRNIYISGETRSFGVGNYDCFVALYNSSYIQIWNTTWGGASNDYGNDIGLDSFGNIYVAGETSSFGMGAQEAFIVKYNNQRIQVWNGTWGTGGTDRGEAIAIESEDNFFLTGSCQPMNVFITKFTIDRSPISNHPSDFSTYAYSIDEINWILSDDYGGGEYRVLVNDTKNNYYVWTDWTVWQNNSDIGVIINRSAPGQFNYILEFTDSRSQSGISDNVLITVINNKPTSNHPNDITTLIDGSENIEWVLEDDFGGGYYKIIANDSQGDYYTWIDWTLWLNESIIEVPISRQNTGFYNYTIIFRDYHNEYGTSDTVIVKIIISSETPIIGYDIFLIIGITSITILLLKKKLLKKSN